MSALFSFATLALVSGSIILLKFRFAKNKRLLRSRHSKTDFWTELAELLFCELPGNERIEKLLRVGANYLELDGASLSCMQEDRLIPFAYYGQAPAKTYCAHTIQSKTGLTTIDYAALSGWRASPVYRETGLETYLGVALRRDARVLGSVGFYSRQARERIFSDEEKAFARTLAQWISVELDRKDLQQGESCRTDNTRLVS